MCTDVEILYLLPKALKILNYSAPDRICLFFLNDITSAQCITRRAYHFFNFLQYINKLMRFFG